MVEPLQDFRIHVADKDTDPKIKHPSGNRSLDASQPIVTVRVVTHEALQVTSFRFIIARQKQLSATW